MCCRPAEDVLNPEVCAPTESYNCSKSFYEDNHVYYTHCPRVDKTMCGTDEEDFVLYADTELQTFRYTGLQRISKNYGIK